MPIDINELNARLLCATDLVHRDDLPAMTDGQAAAFTARMQTAAQTVPFPNPQRVETETGPVLEAHAAQRTDPNSVTLTTMHRPLDTAGRPSGPAQGHARGQFITGDLSPQARALLLPPLVPGAPTHGLTPPERAAEEVRRLRLDPEAGSASSSPGSEHAPLLPPPSPYPSEVPGASGPSGPETEWTMGRARARPFTDAERRQIHDLRNTPDANNQTGPTPRSPPRPDDPEEPSAPCWPRRGRTRRPPAPRMPRPAGPAPD